MKKPAKILSIILCLVLLTVMAASCSNSNNDGKNAATAGPVASDSSWQQPTPGSGGIALPIFKDPTKMRFMLFEVAAYPHKEGFIVIPELSKRTNADIELLPTPVEGFPEKVNVMLMADDYPEIICGIDFAAIVEQGLQGGKFLNILEYLDDMPNFKALLEKNPKLYNYKASADAMYSLPVTIHSEKNLQSLLQFSYLTRKDLIDKHGLKVPGTFDEVYEYLKQLKQLYPESEPWTDRTGVLGLIDKLGVSWGINSLYGKYKYDEKENTFTFAMDDPKYKEIVQYLRKLYMEQIIDQEFILMSVEQWMAKLVSGTSFFACDWYSRAQVLTNAARANGDNEYLMNVILPPVGPGGEPVTRSTQLSRTFVTVSSKVENPHEIMKLLDYFYYSKDGAILNQLGIEGQTFRWVDESQTTWEYLPQEDITDIADYRPYQSKFGVYMDLMMGVKTEEFGLVQAQQNKDIYNYNIMQGHTILPPPEMVFNSDEVERLQELGSFDTFVDYELSKYIIGENDMSTWEDFVRQAGDEYGGYGQLEVFNQSWDRRK